MFCKSPFDAGGSRRGSPSWFWGETSDRNAGSLFGRTESGNAQTYKCSLFCDERIRHAGGFEEKKKAAQKAGAELIVIARPKEEGKSLQEVKKLMEEFLAKENLLWYTTNVAKKHACGYLRRCLSRRIRTVSEENKTCGSKKPIWRKETWALFQWNSF